MTRLDPEQETAEILAKELADFTRRMAALPERQTVEARIEIAVELKELNSRLSSLIVAVECVADNT